MLTYPIIKSSLDVIFTSNLLENETPIASNAEKHFYNFLLLDKKLNIDKNKQFYIETYLFRPDILFISKNLMLDIEIDEPYTLADSKENSNPIHYIGSDDYRDEILNQNGITVLRFDEYQVQYHRETCYEIIRNVISGKYYLENISYEPTFLINRWTRSEAQRFIKENKREFFEYSTVEIVESATNILKSFENFNSLIGYIKKNYIQNFDQEKEIIFLPFNISNQKIHDFNKGRMIYCDFLVTQNVFNNGMRYDAFREIPRYQVFENEDSKLFNYIIKLKSEALKVKLIEPMYSIQELYNIVFWGTVRDTIDSNLSYKLIV